MNTQRTAISWVIIGNHPNETPYSPTLEGENGVYQMPKRKNVLKKNRSTSETPQFFSEDFVIRQVIYG
jgi:hypothetical protein